MFALTDKNNKYYSAIMNFQGVFALKWWVLVGFLIYWNLGMGVVIYLNKGMGSISNHVACFSGSIYLLITSVGTENN